MKGRQRVQEGVLGRRKQYQLLVGVKHEEMSPAAGGVTQAQEESTAAWCHHEETSEGARWGVAKPQAVSSTA